MTRRTRLAAAGMAAITLGGGALVLDATEGSASHGGTYAVRVTVENLAPSEGTLDAEASVDGAVVTTASAEVVVRNPQGLHLRPATEFARVAQASGCEVRVRYGETEGDGTSVLELAMMAIRPGAHLHIEARGEGCDAAIRELVALVGRDFRN